MVVAGEWFAMWQSQTWNGQEAAFRFYMAVLGVLILLNHSDPDLPTRQGRGDGPPIASHGTAAPPPQGHPSHLRRHAAARWRRAVDRPGERLCLVGRNGSGKSTLLKIAAGLDRVRSRAAASCSHRLTIRYLPQEPDLSGFATTAAFVEAGLAPGDDPHRARYLLESLGLTGEEEPARLSGGESRRAALARVLAPEPDILLLDEPTNHLDVAAIEGLEDVLKALALGHGDDQPRPPLPGESLASDGVARSRRTRRLDKGFAAFEAWRDAILEEEELARHKLDRRIVQEEHWLRYGVSARRKRNQRRLGRCRASRAAQARARWPHRRRREADGAGGEETGGR